jgi:hypothetical protein
MRLRGSAGRYRRVRVLGMDGSRVLIMHQQAYQNNCQ